MSRKLSGKEKKNKHDVNSTKKWHAERIILLFLIVGVATLLFAGPFQRGLYFPRELLMANIAIFSLLIFWGLFNIFKENDLMKGTSIFGAPLDICILVFLIAYLASFFVAVHKRDALEELLKITSYLIVYLAVIDICRNWWFTWPKINSDQGQQGPEMNIPPGLNLILHVLFISATAVTIASLGAAVGNWHFAGAYAGSRIASPMGYANTAAAYLMAAYFLALGLAPLAKKWMRTLYLAPATLMLMTVILTFSRGAWLLLAPLSMLLIIASAPGERFRSFLYLLATALVALPAAFIVDPFFRANISLQAWLIILATAVLASLLGLLIELYLKQSHKLRTVSAWAAVVISLSVLFILFLKPALSPLYLELPAEDSAQVQVVRQIIENVEGNERYQLSMEVNATNILLSGTEEPEFTWGLKVLGGSPDYQDVELLDYKGSATNGWKEKIMSFQTSEGINRLEVQLYVQEPGAAVTARAVTISSADKEQKVGFFFNRVLPQRLYDRLFSLSRDRNVDRRFELFQDALKIIKDYPLLGTGGGGWAALYRGYQDQLYNSREVHNHYLQVWIEAGLFGFLAFIGIWISFAVAFIRNCLKGRASPRLWQFWAASFLPVIALGAHSFIDWSFSLPAVGIVLFTLLGAGRSLDQIRWFGKPRSGTNNSGKRNLVAGIVGAIMGVFLLTCAIVLFKGLDATWRSQEYLRRNNLKQAVIEMETAIRLDPFRADSFHNLSVIYEDQIRRTQSTKNIQEMIRLAERAYELEPTNPLYLNRYGELLFHLVNAGDGLSYIDQVMTIRPLQKESYISPALARLQLAEFHIDAGNRNEAEYYLVQIIDLEHLMVEKTGDSLLLAFPLGRANYLLGNYPAAIDYFEAVPERDQFYSEAQRQLSQMLEEDEDVEKE